jgi:hypothetical protein
MSITITTLSGAAAAGDVSINVTSATAFAKRKLINIDGEFLTETADVVSGTTAVAVRRGDQGTAPAAHVNGAIVLVGDANDFPAAPPGKDITQPISPGWTKVTLTANGAIPVPATNQNLYVQLLGTTTNAYTLAFPSSAQIGQELIIQAGAAHAYTVTGPLDTNLDYNYTDLDLATFGGAIGDYFHIRCGANASTATWMVLDKTNVTISDSD